MDKVALLSYVREAIQAVPQVVKYLYSTYKSYDYFLAQVNGLVRGLYNGFIGGEFIDTLANLISGQLWDAYEKAWFDEGGDGVVPDYLMKSYQEAVSSQYGYVDAFYRDIVDARIDQTSLDPLLVRASLWANRYNEAYNEAVRLITLQGGGNMVWIEGDTNEKCSTFLALDGIVARASEWDILGVKPQNGDNKKLECRGWNCQCQLVPTDKRRSRDAYGKIEAAIMGI